MSTQLNSFRFQRIAKTNQIRNHSISELSSHDTLKLAAYNSIFYGSKHNNVSIITGNQLHKLRKEPQVSLDLEYGSAKESLLSVRNKSDNVHKEIFEGQLKNKLLSEQVAHYKKIEEELLEKKNQGKEKVKVLQQKLKNIKQHFLEEDMQKKVLLHIKQRHHIDKVKYDDIKFNYNKQLNFLKKQISIIKGDCKGIVEEEDRAKKLAERLLDHVKEQNRERNQHIESISKMIEQKKYVIQAEEQRQYEIRQIAERAMQDKDQNEKNWGKLLNAQKLLSKLLKDKMDRQMEKFSTVQSAFKNIKIATGIHDSSLLTTKYLNKQSAYGELLEKIAQNQKKIEILKQQAKMLQKQQKKLQEQEKQLLEIRRKETINFMKQQKQLEAMELRQKKIQLKKNTIKTLSIRNIKKFKLFGQSVEKISTANDLQAIANLFKRYLSILLKSLDDLNPEEASIQTLLQAQTNQKVADKLYRVKVGRKRKNSIGEDINVGGQEEEEIIATNDEEDNLSVGRAQVLKNNEKFMKQIKKKYEQKKRLRIEAEPKKKEKEPQKPKIILGQQ